MLFVRWQDFKEFTTGFGIDATPLAKRLFTVFDADSSGTVDALEFIMGMRKWAAQYSMREKLEFAFKLYGKHACLLRQSSVSRSESHKFACSRRFEWGRPPGTA